MRIALSVLAPLTACLLCISCQPDPAKQIPALEANLAATNSDGAADSLLQIYQDAVKAHPDQHANNLHYLSKAAEIYFDRKKNDLAATRLLNDGLAAHGQGQSLAEPMAVLARIWRAYQYKATPGLSKNPDDIDLMKANLLKNLPWLDSCLVAIDRTMGQSPGEEIGTAATKFIQISEAYSTLVEQSDPNKHVDLLMRAGGLSKSAGDPNTALRLYYSVAEKMSGHPKAPTALFMMAFIYETDLKDMEKAKSTYERFLEKYPNDPDYADDAANALKYLGIPPEELIKQFQQNQQQ